MGDGTAVRLLTIESVRKLQRQSFPNSSWTSLFPRLSSLRVRYAVFDSCGTESSPPIALRPEITVTGCSSTGLSTKAAKNDHPLLLLLSFNLHLDFLTSLVTVWLKLRSKSTLPHLQQLRRPSAWQLTIHKTSLSVHRAQRAGHLEVHILSGWCNAKTVCPLRHGRTTRVV